MHKGRGSRFHDSILSMRDVWLFVKALLKHWLSLMGSALFTFLAIYSAAANRSNTWVVQASVAAAGGLLFVANFMVWREERLKSPHGPQILLAWEFHQNGTDTITFRNVGDEGALNVAAGDFSWAAIKWHRSILMSFIDKGDSKKCEAQFFRELSERSGEMGHMLGILQLPERPKPLSLPVSYESLTRMRFKCVFELDVVQAGERLEIRCSPGKREIST